MKLRVFIRYIGIALVFCVNSLGLNGSVRAAGPALPADSPAPLRGGGRMAITNPAAYAAAAPSQKLSLPQSGSTGISCDTAVSIMPLGDSITKGNSSGIVPDDPAYYISYRKDLWDSLKGKGYDITFVGSQVWGQYYQTADAFNPNNEGHGGWRAGDIAANIYTWLTNNPASVVLLHIGTNDISQSPPYVNADGVQGILDAINQYGQDNGRQIWVILASIIDRVPHSQDTVTFNNNVDTMLNNWNGNWVKVVQVDMYGGAGLVYQGYPNGDMWDDKHPYASGYAKMAAVWFQTLTQTILPYCARDDSAAVVEDSGSNSIDVLANDGGSSLSIVNVSQGVSGGKTALDGNRIDYTPPIHFLGTDTFTYTISGGPIGSVTTAAVQITVNPAGSPPAAVDDKETAVQGTPLVIPASRLLANDSPGQDLQVTAVNSTPNTHGALSLSQGIVTYNANAGYLGAADFLYTVCNSGNACSQGTVYVTVVKRLFLPVLLDRSEFFINR